MPNPHEIERSAERSGYYHAYRLFEEEDVLPDDLEEEARCPAYADRALIEAWWDGFMLAADALRIAADE